MRCDVLRSNPNVGSQVLQTFANHGHNTFVIPEADSARSQELQDDHDYEHLIRILKSDIIPRYYERPDEWCEIVKNSMREVVPMFDSSRMAAEYYERLFD